MRKAGFKKSCPGRHDIWTSSFVCFGLFFSYSCKCFFLWGKKIKLEVSFEGKVCSFLFISCHLSLSHWAFPREQKVIWKAGKARSGEAQFFDTPSFPFLEQVSGLSLQKGVTRSFQSEWYLKAVVGSLVTLWSPHFQSCYHHHQNQLV